MEDEGLAVLLHCLVRSKYGLGRWTPASWSVPLLKCWLAAIHDMLKLNLASRAQDAQAKCGAVVDCLEQVINELKDLQRDHKDNIEPLIAQLKNAVKQVAELSKKPGNSQTFKPFQGKSVQQLHSIIQRSAEAKRPMLGTPSHGNSNSSNGASSPFRTGSRLQIGDSDAWPNQQEAFAAIQCHFEALNSKCPPHQQLQQATAATYNASCALRVGVCDLLLDISTSLSIESRQHRQGRFQQVDVMLQKLKGAWTTEKQLLGAGSSWHNIGGGWIEPTGTGKTGIINLAPYAILGGDVAHGIPVKALVITPNTATLANAYGSMSKEPGRNCLRDILNVVQRSDMLPTAFNLETLPGMKDPAVSAVPARAAAAGSSQRDLDNNAVVAAAAVPLDENLEADMADDDDDDMSDDDDDMMKNIAESEEVRLPQVELQEQALQHSPALQRLAKADYVVANIHQLIYHLRLRKLEALFPRDYFGVVIVDEAHHAAALSWKIVLEYFAPASKVLVTATPFRGDRGTIPMQIIGGSWDETLKIKQRVTEGLCSNVAYAPVPVVSVNLREEGHEVTYSDLEEIKKLGERRDIQKAAMEDLAVRQSVMRHSMKLMEQLRRQSGLKHTIIAQACDIADAEQMTEEWRAIVAAEHGRGKYIVEYTHSKLPEKQQAETRDAVKSGNVDVIVQVNQLGEGFDAPCISVAAVFKVFRSIGPFMQLLGRAVRRPKDLPPQHSANVAYLVAHPLLGYHKHWKLYCEEKQGNGTELGGSGTAREVEVASFQVSKQLGVQYLVSPEQIQDRTKPQKKTATAGLAINLQVKAAVAAASSAPVAAAHSPAAAGAGPSPAAGAGPSPAAALSDDVPEAVLADLRLLNSATRTQLRQITKRHACLENIKTGSNQHIIRTAAGIAEEIRQALQRQYPSAAL